MGAKVCFDDMRQLITGLEIPTYGITAEEGDAVRFFALDVLEVFEEIEKKPTTIQYDSNSYAFVFVFQMSTHRVIRFFAYTEGEFGCTILSKNSIVYNGFWREGGLKGYIEDIVKRYF